MEKTILYKVQKVAKGALPLSLLTLLPLFSSCNDFLDIQPQNEVVLENFWKEKADAASVLTSCYESLESNDALNRMVAWGELRSDNMKAGTSTPNDLNEILKESLLPSNPQ